MPVRELAASDPRTIRSFARRLRHVSPNDRVLRVFPTQALEGHRADSPRFAAGAKIILKRVTWLGGTQALSPPKQLGAIRE